MLRHPIAFLLAKGGWLMIVLIVPIVACSVMSLAIIFERILYFIRLKNLKLNAVTRQIMASLKKRRFAEAVSICESTPCYLTNILKAGISWRKHSKDVIKEAMENSSLYEIPQLEKNLYLLSTIAHISPLMGLLGTVVGLVKSFYIIEQKAAGAGVINPSDIAGGIWVALLTTVLGLCVAIVSYLAYNYFVHRVNSHILGMEQASTELLELLFDIRPEAQ